MNIKYVGPYFSERFEKESYFGTKRVIIRENDDLIRFFKRIRISQHSKRDIYIWLSRIMKNARASECDNQYRIRETNKFAWNNVIDFLRHHLKNHESYVLIPNKKRKRTVSFKCK